MALAVGVSQTLGVAGLQLKLMARKRFILVLLTLWFLNLLLDAQLDRSVSAVRLLLSSLLVSDFLVIGMTCGLIADDAEQETFPFVLSHGIERRVFLLGKLLPVVAVVLLFATLSHAAILAVTQSGAALSVAAASGRLFAAAVMSLARILVIAGVTAFMAVMVTNRSLACVGSLVYVYGLGYGLQRVVLADSPGVWVWETLMPWRDNFERAISRLFSGGIAPQTLGAAVVQPLVYAAVFGVLAERRLRRRDLVRGAATD